MKAFAILLLLAPAFVVGQQDMVHIRNENGVSNLHDLASAVNAANKIISYAAENYASTPLVDPNGSLNCCGQTPCFVACPVDGIWKVSFQGISKPAAY